MNMLPPEHDFKQSLKVSHAASDLPIWWEVYVQFFPNISSWADHRENGPWQKEGIDRSLTLSNSKQILIDEKVRLKPYNDIFLEYISSDVTNAPGWVCKPLRADFIAYAILPRGKVYLLPVLQLQQAWTANKGRWKRVYRELSVQNKGYCTLGVAVPVRELFRRMCECQVAEFEPIF